MIKTDIIIDETIAYLNLSGSNTCTSVTLEFCDKYGNHLEPYNLMDIGRSILCYSSIGDKIDVDQRNRELIIDGVDLIC